MSKTRWRSGSIARLTPLSRFGQSDRQEAPDLAFSETRVTLANSQQVKSDGSLDIFIQHEEPKSEAQKANWLPAPKEGFYLNLRLYVPDDSLPKGTWKPPVVKADK